MNLVSGATVTSTAFLTALNDALTQAGADPASIEPKDTGAAPAEDIEKEARKIYSSYVQDGLKKDLAFKGVGQAYITFAIKEPKLFQLLFMKKQDKSIGVNKILPEIEENYEAIVNSISDNYPVSNETAVDL